MDEGHSKQADQTAKTQSAETYMTTGGKKGAVLCQLQ
jgi:hypothetical protein